MIDKNEFLLLEEQIESYITAKKIKTTQAKQLIDSYFNLIIQYFKSINDVTEIDMATLSSLPIVPMNFEERYQYIEVRKYHYMGYKQMKTMKDELIKMNASYKIRQKHGVSKRN
ncbi:hypothetical protein N9R04_02020 [Staphylococcus sp. SQ8-PEA]|uniref:YpoC-like domain-containing protein n=1 Tax=Staphylococcus marylandisciuri TaxID=2981529 RepID=A0ABT2QNF0_9STAP|nr:hypothetical protein [Staphylococcus marylandisciuri]MCU5745499.1 hypothetical protein [Staphylococcus marylandisciuri]